MSENKDRDSLSEFSADQILTLSEVAEYLKLSEKTIGRMVKKNEIPCAKIGSQWRFSRRMIDDWLFSRMQVIPRNDIARLIENDGGIVPISRLIREELTIELEPDTKENILGRMAERLFEKGYIHNSTEYLARLIERENMASTAIGRGIALPHIRNPRENPEDNGPAILAAICREGTDFNSHDGEPTYLFFLPVTDSEVVHLRILAELGRLFSGIDDIKPYMDNNVLSLILEMEKRV